MTYDHYIKELGRGAKGARSLDVNMAQALFADMLDNKVPPLELGAIVIALRIKSESLEELLGFKRAMDSHCHTVAAPDGPRCVILPSYNGARRQANLMPLLALLLAARRVPVLIQGRHDFDTRSNPFELLDALGIHQASTIAETETQLADRFIACIGVKQLLPGLDSLLALRRPLGVRGSAHTMAKLVDPCPGRSVRVVAVTHPEYLERMHDFLLSDGGVAMLLRGTEGEAFANPRRCPRLMAYANGQAHEICPAEDGGAPPLEGLPDVPDIAANAALIQAMLAGQVAIPAPILRQLDALEALARTPAE